MHRFILRDGKIFSSAISPPAEDVLAIKDDENHVIAYCFMNDESKCLHPHRQRRLGRAFHLEELDMTIYSLLASLGRVLVASLLVKAVSGKLTDLSGPVDVITSKRNLAYFFWPVPSPLDRQIHCFYFC